MRLRDIIDSPCGLRYMIETLPVASGCALRYFMESEAFGTSDGADREYACLKAFLPVTEDDSLVSLLHSSLCTLKNIGNTLGRIASSASVDDIELFEVKHLILLGYNVHDLLSRAGYQALAPDIAALEKPLRTLDPDGNRIASFYIYDSYSSELASLRFRLRQEQDQECRNALMEQEQKEEGRLRQEICASLAPYVPALTVLQEDLAWLDIRLAKALQYVRMGLCIPESSSCGTSYKGMFHPYVKSVLESEGKDFTPIDIEFGGRPVIIIGANMGGKTVVLKMAALCQYLYSFGMGIPATSASVEPKREISFISGDAQDMGAGLSSFAAEMTAIDKVVRASSAPESSIVAMIDEPARSTNPIEGTALVEALVELMARRKVSLLLTTHYNISSPDCRRLRVTGIENGKMNYRLCPAPDGEVPHEALNVAESLNISPEWIGEAKKLLEKV